MMKLAVGYPWSSPFTFTDFVDSVVNLRHPAVAFDSLGCSRTLETRFFRGSGWCSARRHLSICEQAMAWDADLICILGADQVYEPDLLERLVDRWNEGYEFMSALVPCRGYVGWQKMKPFQPMAWRLKESSPEHPIRKTAGVSLSRDLVELIDPDDGDMQEAHFIGSGVILFHADHLRAIERPWFFERINPVDQMRLASMDTTFSWRMQMEAGARLWVDTTIEVKHCHVFQIDDTYQDRFADWSVVGVGPPDVCVFQPQIPDSASKGIARTGAGMPPYPLKNTGRMANARQDPGM